MNAYIAESFALIGSKCRGFFFDWLNTFCRTVDCGTSDIADLLSRKHLMTVAIRIDSLLQNQGHHSKGHFDLE